MTARNIALPIVILPLAAIVALGYFFSPHRFEGIEQTMASYFSDRTIDLSYADEIERESAPFVRGTRYEGHINARRPKSFEFATDDGFINGSPSVPAGMND